MATPTYEISTGTGTADGGATTITSGSITPSGSNRFAFVHVTNSDSSVANCTGVTLNGNACTQVSTNNPLTGGSWNHSLWRYIGPAASAMTATATFAASQGERLIQVVCYSGVDQTTPLGTAVKGTTATATITNSAIGAAVGDLVVDFAMFGDGSFPDTKTLVPQSSQNERIETKTSPTGYDDAAVADLVAGSTSETRAYQAQNGGSPDAPDGGLGMFSVALKGVAASDTLFGQALT